MASAETESAHSTSGEHTVYGCMTKLIGSRIRSELDVLRLVERRVKVAIFKPLQKRLKLNPKLIAPEATMRRRLDAPGGRFTEAESERLVRLVRVYAEALVVFGDEVSAVRWLNSPLRLTDSEHPVTALELSTRESGARVVESKLRRTVHGVF